MLSVCTENKFSVTQRRLEKVWKNDKPIALNILYVPYNIKGIRHACKPKYNFKL